ncbi:recombinase family protein [Streptomyces sp. NPDC057197]|uniref:recombinase family protein n=1 Tax=Streptomyces sp. NPDC057197 TaxID=3346045 RepID=UPI00363EB57A
MSQKTVVIYDRLSRLFAEEAPDHRIAACKAYAAQRGWRVVHVATDTNVSGASKLEDRSGMREVLAWMPRADYVLAAKLDRFARSVLEFYRLLDAARSTRTTIVTADGMVSPENSDLMVGMLAIFAEHERNMIKARITASKEHFRSRGNHLGGLAPYGYMSTGPVNDKRWAIDETAAAIVRECADKIIHHGASVAGLARELTARGIPSPADHARQRDGRKVRGTKWHTTTLRDVLYTPALRGWLVQAKPGCKRGALTHQPVLDAEGRPVSPGPAILDAQTWTSVRAVLDSKAKGRGVDRPSRGKALLLHIARCAECNGPMYKQRRSVNGKDYSTYVCPKGVGKAGIHRPNVVLASSVDELVTHRYLTVFGGSYLKRWAEPDGSAVLQLSEVRGQIDRLVGSLAQLDPSGRAGQLVIQQITALEQRETELRKEADHAEGRWVDAGGPVSVEWERRDDEGRRALLADMGTVAEIRPATPGAPKRFDASRVAVRFDGPEWVRDTDPATAALRAIAMDEMEA